MYLVGTFITALSTVSYTALRGAQWDSPGVVRQIRTLRSRRQELEMSRWQELNGHAVGNNGYCQVQACTTSRQFLTLHKRSLSLDKEIKEIFYRNICE